MSRCHKIDRKAAETDISLSLNLDGSGKSEISTGCGFFDHMLTLFARHGGFDLTVKCDGDIEVDAHHTVEDVGICLGKAFRASLGDMRGICRYGDIVLPMDEALAFCAIDISGRPYLHYDVPVTAPMIGDYDAQLTVEFMRALAYNMGATLHVKLEYGVNEHHITEAVYKAVARALSQAMEETGGEILSAKGVL